MSDQGSNSLGEIEKVLLNEILQRAHLESRVIFILGAPRTGSTILYQSLVAGYELPYIANLTNTYFASVPILGLSMQAKSVDYRCMLAESEFGKVKGMLQPSEGSAVMANWFGGGHPSELLSCEILPGQAEHLRKSIQAIGALFGRPLVIKNAWNCFRISALARELPDAEFVWIRRDIAASAKSDLAARYVTKGTPEGWNSATPRNIETLRLQPYWEQVVENQFEFTRAISESFSRLVPERHTTVWFEDLQREPSRTLEELGTRLPSLRGLTLQRALPMRDARNRGDLSAEDERRIDSYVERQASRMAACRFFDKSRSGADVGLS